MPKFYPSILDKNQTSVLVELSDLMEAEEFYLGGGTAIALQLGHRMSEDFDWFRDFGFDPLNLASLIQQTSPLIVTMTAKDTLWGTIAKVKTSFFRFSYPNLEETINYPKFGVQLASLPDLVCMKLNAISQRGSKKDFIDLFFLEKRFSLEEMLSFYQERFDTKNVAHVIYSLTYFVDADKDPTPRMLKKADWNAIKESIRNKTIKLH